MKTPSTEREFVDRIPFVRTCIEKLASTILVKQVSDCKNFGLSTGYYRGCTLCGQLFFPFLANNIFF